MIESSRLTSHFWLPNLADGRLSNASGMFEPINTSITYWTYIPADSSVYKLSNDVKYVAVQYPNSTLQAISGQLSTWPQMQSKSWLLCMMLSACAIRFDYFCVWILPDNVTANKRPLYTLSDGQSGPVFNGRPFRLNRRFKSSQQVTGDIFERRTRFSHLILSPTAFYSVPLPHPSYRTNTSYGYPLTPVLHIFIPSNCIQTARNGQYKSLNINMHSI